MKTALGRRVDATKSAQIYSAYNLSDANRFLATISVDDLIDVKPMVHGSILIVYAQSPKIEGLPMEPDHEAAEESFERGMERIIDALNHNETEDVVRSHLAILESEADTGIVRSLLTMGDEGVSPCRDIPESDVRHLFKELHQA